MLDNVEKWEAPDASTFVIRMKKGAADFPRRPSAVQRPIVIIPAETRTIPPQRLTSPSDRPFHSSSSSDSHVQLKRYERLPAEREVSERTGFGG